jgi:hypothetical protein
MPGRRICYRNWIVEIGRDPQNADFQREIESAPPNPIIVAGVRRAIERLSAQEREFIQLYYFEGRDGEEVSTIMLLPGRRFETLQRRVMKRLRTYLRQELEGRFGTENPDTTPGCPICRHVKRKEIDHLLKAKSPNETWRKVIRILRDRYGLRGICPQRIIGHMTYHLVKERGNDGPDQETAR